ncbi:MAG: DUF3108 domain-containing protein [Anaerolineales bacterium]
MIAGDSRVSIYQNIFDTTGHYTVSVDDALERIKIGKSKAAAVVSLAALRPAAAAGQRLHYQVWLGGAAVMDVTMTLQVETESYSVGLQGVLAGPPSWLYDIRLAGLAEGTLAAGTPVPARYRLEQSDDGKPEWLQLDFDAGGLPVRSTDPPLGDEKREPLDAAAIRGSLDPLSGLLSLLLQATAAGGACPAGTAIYDGRRRFDVGVVDRGLELMGASLINSYQGPARLCEALLTPRGGFRRSGRDLEAFPRSLMLYVAPPGPDPWALPVRIQAETALGALILHLVLVEPL